VTNTVSYLFGIVRLHRFNGKVIISCQLSACHTIANSALKRLVTYPKNYLIMFLSHVATYYDQETGQSMAPYFPPPIGRSPLNGGSTVK